MKIIPRYHVLFSGLWWRSQSLAATCRYSTISHDIITASINFVRLKQWQSYICLKHNPMTSLILFMCKSNNYSFSWVKNKCNIYFICILNNISLILAKKALMISSSLGLSLAARVVAWLKNKKLKNKQIEEFILVFGKSLYLQILLITAIFFFLCRK